MSQNLSAYEILDLMSGQGSLGSEFAVIVKDCLPSTNDYVFELIGQATTSIKKTIVLAESQTAGKGRLGRTWISPPGNIYMSIYWPFNCALDKLYGLSIVVGIAIARVLQHNGLEEVKLKWPNDIFWQDRKLGGILIETKQGKSGSIDVVIGIGINIIDMETYQQQIQQKNGALENLLQREVCRNKLVAQIVAELHKILENFAVNGFDVFMLEWKKFEHIQTNEIIK